MVHVGGVGRGEKLTCIDTQFEPSGMHLGRGKVGGKEEGRGGEGRRRGGEGREGEGRMRKRKEEGWRRERAKNGGGREGGSIEKKRGVCLT